jgi:predicted metalloprotease
MFFGGENVQMLTPLLEQINQGESTTIEQRDLTAKELEEQAFIRTIVADNEDVWTTIFKENNLNYRRPNIVYLVVELKQHVGMQPLIQVLSTAQQTKKCIWICLF